MSKFSLDGICDQILLSHRQPLKVALDDGLDAAIIAKLLQKRPNLIRTPIYFNEQGIAEGEEKIPHDGNGKNGWLPFPMFVRHECDSESAERRLTNWLFPLFYAVQGANYRCDKPIASLEVVKVLHEAWPDSLSMLTASGHSLLTMMLDVHAWGPDHMVDLGVSRWWKGWEQWHSGARLPIIQWLLTKAPQLVRMLHGKKRLPLHFATKGMRYDPGGNEELQILQAVIGAYPNGLHAVDSNGKTPLIASLSLRAVNNDPARSALGEGNSAPHSQLALHLLSDGSFPEAARIPDSAGWLPIHFATKSRNLKAVERLLELWPECVHARTNGNVTPLSIACTNLGSYGPEQFQIAQTILRLLLSHIKDVASAIAAEYSDSRNLLHVLSAAEFPRDQPLPSVVMDLFHIPGIDWNKLLLAQNKRLFTPLTSHVVVNEKSLHLPHLDYVKLLLNRCPAAANLPNDDGDTPLLSFLRTRSILRPFFDEYDMDIIQVLLAANPAMLFLPSTRDGMLPIMAMFTRNKDHNCEAIKAAPPASQSPPEGHPAWGVASTKKMQYPISSEQWMDLRSVEECLRLQWPGSTFEFSERAFDLLLAEMNKVSDWSAAISEQERLRSQLSQSASGGAGEDEDWPVALSAMAAPVGEPSNNEESKESSEKSTSNKPTRSPKAAASHARRKTTKIAAEQLGKGGAAVIANNLSVVRDQSGSTLLHLAADLLGVHASLPEAFLFKILRLWPEAAVEPSDSGQYVLHMLVSRCNCEQYVEFLGELIKSMLHTDKALVIDQCKGMTNTATPFLYLLSHPEPSLKAIQCFLTLVPDAIQGLDKSGCSALHYLAGYCSARCLYTVAQLIYYHPYQFLFSLPPVPHDHDHEREVGMITKLLLSSKPKLATQVGGSRKVNPLHLQVNAHSPSISVIREIIHADPDCLKQKDAQGFLPLAMAFSSTKIRATQVSDLKLAYLGKLPGLRVAKVNHEMIALLLQHYPTAASIEIAVGTLPLHLAVNSFTRRCSMQTLQLLLKENSKATYSIDRDTKMLPLHRVVSFLESSYTVAQRKALIPSVDLEHLNLLLSLKTEVDTVKAAGGVSEKYLPLHFICSTPNRVYALTLAKALISHYRAALMTPTSGQSVLPLHLACSTTPLGEKRAFRPLIQLLLREAPEAAGVRTVYEAYRKCHVVLALVQGGSVHDSEGLDLNLLAKVLHMRPAFANEGDSSRILPLEIAANSLRLSECARMTWPDAFEMMRLLLKADPKTLIHTDIDSKGTKKWIDSFLISSTASGHTRKLLFAKPWFYPLLSLQKGSPRSVEVLNNILRWLTSLPKQLDWRSSKLTDSQQESIIEHFYLQLWWIMCQATIPSTEMVHPRSDDLTAKLSRSASDGSGSEAPALSSDRLLLNYELEQFQIVTSAYSRIANALLNAKSTELEFIGSKRTKQQQEQEQEQEFDDIGEVGDTVETPDAEEAAPEHIMEEEKSDDKGLAKRSEIKEQDDMLLTDQQKQACSYLQNINSIAEITHSRTLDERASALHIAAKYGNKAACQALLECSQKASISLPDRFGLAPLMYCNKLKHTECWKFLREQTKLHQRYRDRYELSATDWSFHGSHLIAFARDTTDGNMQDGTASLRLGKRTTSVERAALTSVGKRGQAVIIKFFDNKQPWMDELNSLQLVGCGAKNNHFVHLLESYDDSQLYADNSDQVSDSYSLQRDYPYCLVFERGMYSLDSLLETRKILSSDEAKIAFKHVCNALACLHNEKHMIHGDIKIENVVLFEDQRYRLIDFDAARPLGEPLAPQRTFNMITPQRARAELKSKGVKQSDGTEYDDTDGHTAAPQHDLWGLALILYELRVGKPLFKGGPQDERSTIEHLATLTDIEVEAHLNKLQRNGQLSRTEFHLLKHMLKVDPQERWTLSELCDPMINAYMAIAKTATQISNEDNGLEKRLVDHIDRVGAKVDSLQVQLTKQHEITMRAIFSVHEDRFPRYFLLLPDTPANNPQAETGRGVLRDLWQSGQNATKEARNFVSLFNHYKLIFLCEGSKNQHRSCSKSSGGISIKHPGARLRQLQPFLIATSMALKVLSVAGKFAGIPIPSELPFVEDCESSGSWDELAAWYQYDVAAAAAVTAVEEKEEDGSRGSASNKTKSTKLHSQEQLNIHDEASAKKAYGPAFQALKDLLALNKLDIEKNTNACTNLFRVQRLDGSTSWVCKSHYEDYPEGIESSASTSRAMAVTTVSKKVVTHATEQSSVKNTQAVQTAACCTVQ